MSLCKTSTEEYGINPLYSYSAPGYIWKTGVKMSKLTLDFIKNKELLILLEKKRAWNSRFRGDRYIQSDEKKTFTQGGK